jgi:hypothetical protein
MLKGLFLIWTVVTILQTAMQRGRCTRELDALWQRGKRGASEAGAAKKLKISIYDSDRYGRLVGDVDCNGVSVQVRNYTDVPLQFLLEI